MKQVSNEDYQHPLPCDEVDATFDALRRVPFRQVFLYVTRTIKLGQRISDHNEKYITDSGWTIEEFCDEIRKRQIPLDIVQLSDSEWREQFRLGEIY